VEQEGVLKAFGKRWKKIKEREQPREVHQEAVVYIQEEDLHRREKHH